MRTTALSVPVAGLLAAARCAARTARQSAYVRSISDLLRVVGLCVPLCLASAQSAGDAGRRSQEIANRIAAHTTPDQKALLERWRESFDASLKAYLDGSAQDAIPLLLRYLPLEVQAQKVSSDVIRAAKVEPGLGADAVVASNLALGHGRLAASYLETGNVDRC